MNATGGLRDRIRSACSFSFARSGGPGGQNVNKVSSKVVARLRLDAPGLLPSGRLEQTVARLGRRVNERSELVVTVQDTRDQGRNREIAVERLSALVAGALRRPRARKATRPTARSREERLAAKRHRARIKAERSAAPDQ